MTKIFKGAFLECPDPKHIEKVQKSGKTTFFVHPIQRFFEISINKTPKKAYSVPPV